MRNLAPSRVPQEGIHGENGKAIIVTQIDKNKEERRKGRNRSSEETTVCGKSADISDKAERLPDLRSEQEHAM